MPSSRIFRVFNTLFPRNNCDDEGREHEACMQQDAHAEQVKTRRKSHAACLCCGLASFLFALLASANICILVMMLKLNDKHLHMLRRIESHDQKPIGCIPCQNIRLHPAEDKVNFRLLKVNTETDECCAANSKQLGTLMDLTFERKYRIAKAKGTFDVPQMIYVDVSNGSKYLSNHKPAAHLMASYDLDTKKATEGIESPVMIRMWNYNKDIAFVGNGLEYKDGRLIVHKEGSYYVYSNVAFLKYYTREKERALSDHALMHMVVRYNIIYPNGGEERLFEAVKSQCWAKHKRYGEYVSHLGGVLKLKKGDEIYVKVRDLRSLAQRPKATYFGMYMI